MSHAAFAPFQGLPQAESDIIFALTSRFQSAQKCFSAGSLTLKPFNLGIGKFVDDNGRTPLMSSVRKALQFSFEQRAGEKISGGYLPILGCTEYIRALEELVFGEIEVARLRSEGIVSGCQTLGGTGACFVQAFFLKKLGVQEIALSNPTWGNHKKIYSMAGLRLNEYGYYDYKTSTLTFDSMIGGLERCAAGSAVSLHACCHNPTGADPSREQWERIVQVLKERQLIAVFDAAYAGFAKDLPTDLFSIRECVKQGVPTLVAFSFSKIASLYEERLGGCLVALPKGCGEHTRVESALESVQRPSISNPPAIVGRAMGHLLTSTELRSEWEGELAADAKQIQHGGELIASALDRLGVAHGGVNLRNGMFAILPFSTSQVEQLEREQQVYMLPDGRINVAAIKDSNVEEISSRIAKVVKA
ncbi:MAG: aminotransferase class I/II-fold pyridoxal phosphate-dependent enzyme [Bdellovibrionales bacterium]|nr:aminotransferase class I/II-fold pyridoxal phosphate-dependent enzyme [Bdellovibrionales bacterium]